MLTVEAVRMRIDCGTDAVRMRIENNRFLLRNFERKVWTRLNKWYLTSEPHALWPGNIAFYLILETLKLSFFHKAGFVLIWIFCSDFLTKGVFYFVKIIFCIMCWNLFAWNPRYSNWVLTYFLSSKNYIHFLNSFCFCVNFLSPHISQL